MALFMLLVFGLLFGYISGSMAQAKNRSFGSWFFVGFFFGLLGLLIAHVATPLEKREIAG